MLKFQIQSFNRGHLGEARARAGIITLDAGPNPWGVSHWEIETPMFMPVGTQATVKTLTPEDLKNAGAQIILGNTYHLFLRPGHERVARFGGLSKFQNWKGPTLTDSGGFQVFSLAGLNKITDQGVWFQSHLDGKKHFLTPELSMEIQKSLGSNIVMAFDQCPPFPASEELLQNSMRRTVEWAKRGLEVPLQPFQNRFGIFQGGLSVPHRLQSIAELKALPFDGFALGGFAIGEPMEMMHAVVEKVAPEMPFEKPRYLMGVGRPEDLIEAVKSGIDLFDCVLPTRNARNGQLFTSRGRINIKNARFQDDESPLDPDCSCETCRNYTKGYLRHLFVAGEHLSGRLNTIHNVHFFIHLMKKLRKGILENRLEQVVQDFYAQFKQNQGNLGA